MHLGTGRTWLALAGLAAGLVNGILAALPPETEPVTFDGIEAPLAAGTSGPWSFRGTAAPGTFIVLKLTGGPAEGPPVDTILNAVPATADASGRWTIRVDVSPLGGTFTFVAVAVDAEGRVLAVSAPAAVTIEPAELIPTLDTVTAPPAPGSDAGWSFVGKAGAGQPVLVRVKSAPADSGLVAGGLVSSTPVTADDTGKWALSSIINTVAGNYAFAAETVNARGGVLASSPPRAAAVSAPPVELTIGPITAPLSAGPSIPWTFSGTATPGSAVHVTLRQGPAGVSGVGEWINRSVEVADASGGWTVRAEVSPLAGTFVFVATTVGPQGETIDTSASVTVTVAPSVEVRNVTVSGEAGMAIAPVQIPTTGSPTRFSAPGLAGYGLAVSATGLITGVPSRPAAGVPVAVTAGNAYGDSAPATILLSIAPDPPPPVPVIEPVRKADQTITFVSPAGNVPAEAPVMLAATASSGLPVAYAVMSGPASLRGNVLTFSGTGTVLVKVSQPGSDTYAAAPDAMLAFTAVPVTRLVNLSSRLRVSGRDAAGASVAGFVVGGSSAADVLIRAAGPALAAYGITDPLASPRLQVFAADGRLVGANRGWGGDADVAAAGRSVGAFPFPAGSSDAALIVSLPPGAYTAQVTSETDGTALIEVYDLRSLAAVPLKHLVNVSTRGAVAGTTDPVIAGFVVTGAGPKQVLIRAVGPGLAAFGVADALRDAGLNVYDAGGRRVAMNDNWGVPQSVPGMSGPFTADDLAAAALQAGAFALARGSADAAVIVTLPPGAYTAVATGANGTAGSVLVEVYEWSDGS